MNSKQIPKYDAADCKRISSLFCNLPAGTYVVHTSFANPCRIAQQFYGFEGITTIPAGYMFRIRRFEHPNNMTQVSLHQASSGHLCMSGTDYGHAVRFVDYDKSEGTPVSMTQRRQLRFVEMFIKNATLQAPTFGQAVSEQSSFSGLDVLALLIEIGTLTQEQVFAAAATLDALDVDNTEKTPNLRSFRIRHGIA